MLVNLNTFIPLPGPYVPIPFTPPWLERDLGTEAVTPTVKGHESWRVDFTR